jgi:DNA-binding NarL/FixJ family response regulator
MPIEKKVLLVDDHPLFRQGLIALFGREMPEISIREAGSLDQARSELQKEIPGAMILDISLPDGDGLSFAEEVLAANPGLEVYILTMHARRGMIVKAQKAGCRGYFLKEGDGGALLSALSSDGGGFLFSPDLESLISEEGDEDELLSLYAQLTRREKEVLRLLVLGSGYKEVAWTLGISSRTASVHRYNIFKKLHITSDIELFNTVREIGLVVQDIDPER